MKKIKTSWGGISDWYQRLLTEEGTYQKEVILPNLFRLLNIQKGEVVLDLGCGPGFFVNEFAKKGAKIIGVDISKELIEIAKSNIREADRRNILYFISSADDLRFLKEQSVDKVVIILAIQNMENIQAIFQECARILKPEGKLFLVMNHPAFRIPKSSGWEWDSKIKTQYRRIDGYLSESRAKIEMHPSRHSTELSRSPSSGRILKPKDYTFSFHRPLQFYFKALEKSGFAVTRLEEWNSHKKSEPGPRAKAEDRVRKEIPLFLYLEVIKTPS